MTPPKLLIGEDELIAKVIYPEIANRAGVQGIVLVEFIVDKQGHIKDIKITKGLGVGIYIKS